MKKVLLISFFLLLVPITVMAGYNSFINLKVESQIAEPIARVEYLDKKVETVFNENSIEEYNFAVRNSSNDRISEVDFYYTMKVKIDNPNFPIKLELYDKEGNELLKGNLNTSKIYMEKGIEKYDEYKLVAKWNNKENYDYSANISVEVNLLQKEGSV